MDPGGSQNILESSSCVTDQLSGTLLAIREKYLDFNLKPTNISPYDFMTLYSLADVSGFSFMLVFLIKLSIIGVLEIIKHNELLRQYLIDQIFRNRKPKSHSMKEIKSVQS